MHWEATAEIKQQLQQQWQQRFVCQNRAAAIKKTESQKLPDTSPMTSVFAVNLKSEAAMPQQGPLFKLPACSWVKLLTKNKKIKKNNKETLRQCKLKALNHDLVREGAHGDIPFTVCWSGRRCAVVAADRLSHGGD